MAIAKGGADGILPSTPNAASAAAAAGHSKRAFVAGPSLSTASIRQSNVASPRDNEVAVFAAMLNQQSSEDRGNNGAGGSGGSGKTIKMAEARKRTYKSRLGHHQAD